MRIVIVRRERGVAFSMDVCTDNLVAELRALRPHWEIIEVAPQTWHRDRAGLNPADLWKSGSGIRKYYERFWRHPRAINRLSADIFHIMDQTDAHVAYAIKRRQPEAPTVVTCHDLVQFVYPEILRDQSRLPALSMAAWKYSVRGMKKADRVVAVSHSTAKDVSQFLNISPENISVVFNGVNSFFYPLSQESAQSLQLRAALKCASDTICLLNVGSTHQRKNILAILQCLKQLRDRHLSVRLWRVGDDFTPAQKRYIESHQLSPLICELGKPNQSELRRYYNAADVLLAPSLYEGFGLTILEAMACGLPVIAADVSSLPEVAGEAAILVDPENVDAIAEAVVFLSRDSTYRSTLIQRGLDNARSFTWKRAAEQLVSLYESLARVSRLEQYQ